MVPGNDKCLILIISSRNETDGKLKTDITKRPGYPMQSETHTPTELLRPFVKSFMIIESENEITNRVVPNTSFALAFRFRGQISYLRDARKIVLPPVAFSGLRKSVRLIHYAPRSAAVIVLFTETGVSAFVKQPVNELFEQSTSLDNFFPSSEISLIEERLAENDSNASKIAVIERFLLSKLTCLHPDALVSKAVEKIHSTKGNIRIKELASDLYVSLDAFEKRFRRVTGASPKQFSQIVKMNAVIRQKNPSASLLDLVFDNGYFDQPHFNKAFRLFTGQSPRDFFTSASFW